MLDKKTFMLIVNIETEDPMGLQKNYVEYEHDIPDTHTTYENVYHYPQFNNNINAKNVQSSWNHADFQCIAL